MIDGTLSFSGAASDGLWRTVKKTTLVRPVRFKVKSVSGQRENSLVPVEATLLRDRTRAA